MEVKESLRERKLIFIDIYYGSNTISDTWQISIDFGVNPIWIYVLNPSFNICVTLSQLFNLSELEFFHLQNRTILPDS